MLPTDFFWSLRYEGKQTPALQSSTAMGSPMEHCFSCVGSGGLVLDVEADKQRTRDLYMKGIYHLITGKGQTQVNVAASPRVVRRRLGVNKPGPVKPASAAAGQQRIVFFTDKKKTPHPPAHDRFASPHARATGQLQRQFTSTANAAVIAQALAKRQPKAPQHSRHASPHARDRRLIAKVMNSQSTVVDKPLARNLATTRATLLMGEGRTLTKHNVGRGKPHKMRVWHARGTSKDASGPGYIYWNKPGSTVKDDKR